MSKTYALIDATRRKKVNPDWLTPPRLVRLLGPFDLDPCASPWQPWRTARHENTKLEADGLLIPYKGYVWCNPPYGVHIGRWVQRMVAHDNGILLVPASTEAKWFRPLWLEARRLVFLWERLMFCYPRSGKLCPNRWRGLVLAALGPHAARKLASLPVAGTHITNGESVLTGENLYKGLRVR